MSRYYYGAGTFWYTICMKMVKFTNSKLFAKYSGRTSDRTPHDSHRMWSPPQGRQYIMKYGKMKVMKPLKTILFKVHIETLFNRNRNLKQNMSIFIKRIIFSGRLKSKHNYLMTYIGKLKKKKVRLCSAECFTCFTLSCQL